MEWHLRLADRRGLLQGRNLSPVAVVATELLHLADMRENAKKFWNSVRVSLIAGEDNPERIKKIFPELFVPEPREITDDTDVDDIDPASITWVAPSAGGAMEEYLQLQQELERNSTGRLAVRRTDQGAEEGWL